MIENVNVCHTCGTRYGELGFEKPLDLSPGVCEVCNKEASVALAKQYNGLPHLPCAISLAIRARRNSARNSVLAEDHVSAHVGVGGGAGL